MIGRNPDTLFAIFDGWSPVSSVLPPEMEAAVDALNADPGARALLHGTRPAADRFAKLALRVPAVAEYVNAVGFRIAAGFDLTNPTIGERPEIVMGRIQAALDHDPRTSHGRSNALSDEVRNEVPEEHRAEYDDSLTEARLMYRLRDERGLYSDSAAVGLMRLGVVELGRRLHAEGRILVTPATGESFNSFLHLVGAIVTDHGSFASHAAIMGREMGFPAVVGCVDATGRITSSTLVRVDGAAGTVAIVA